MEITNQIIEEGKINVIGAKAAKGKTTMLVKFLYDIVISNDKNALILTTEPTKRYVKILNRMLGVEMDHNDNIDDFILYMDSNIIIKKVDNFTTIADIVNIIKKYNIKFDYLIIDDAYHCLSHCTEDVLLDLNSNIDSELLITTNTYDSVVNSGDEIPLISMIEDGSGLNIIIMKEVHITSDFDKVFLVRKNGNIIGSTVINFKELTFK